MKKFVIYFKTYKAYPSLEFDNGLTSTPYATILYDTHKDAYDDIARLQDVELDKTPGSQFMSLVDKHDIREIEIPEKIWLEHLRVRELATAIDKMSNIRLQIISDLFKSKVL